MRVTGRCHCGAIAYEAEIDPRRVGICHCTDCQMLTGTVYRVSVPAAAQDFKVTRGEPTIYLKRTADSGRVRAHAFCSACGSPMFATQPENPHTYTLRIGNIDQRRELAPMRQMWTKSRLPWVTRDIADLPGPEEE
jgi:hypothetical protein